MNILRNAFLSIVAAAFLFPAILDAQWVQTSGPQGVYCTSLALEDTVLFAGTTGGLFRSADNGGNWTLLNPGTASSTIECLAVNDTNIYVSGYPSYFGTPSQILRSTDLGVTWNALPDTGAPADPWCFTVSDTELLVGDEWGVYLSTDGGTKWNPLDSGVLGYVMSIAAKGNYVIAGTEYDGIYVWSSTDPKWTRDTTGIPYDSSNHHYVTVRDLIVNRGDIFAATYYGVLLSTDSGATWVTVNTGLADSNVVALTTSGDALFAGTKTGGVFLSTNDGTSWTSVNPGLTDKGILSVAATGTNLFAGTASGVWRRPLSEMITPVRNAFGHLPVSFELEQNFPNPFNPSTVIGYRLPENSVVTLKVYDVLGRVVATLVDERQAAGDHSIIFNAARLPSGVYFYRLQAGTLSETKKLTVLK